ncbi:DUF4305 domain-containing protein [Cytobacillus purgationiresistens]|uniref:DUF4305 domain-containing protein n=1 Tax=Cytobacillus purgationiresistens TaxID=863449 RepID=A0ABU0ARH4_9BACI|nr:DUF4305 domain-containing protein [Cytobacillus purgationiresistens]MDQ0273867.1 hypothetical protein [Cytobacillus purgationiresistens]
MSRTPLITGIIYLILGFLLTYFAIFNLQNGADWGFFTYLLLILATFDIGGGIRMIAFHFKIKKLQQKK